jgi:hypothetical protein
MRWKGDTWVSSGQVVSIHTRLASLIFNQKRSLYLSHTTYTKLLPCSCPRARNSFQSNISSHFIRRLDHHTITHRPIKSHHLPS